MKRTFTMALAAAVLGALCLLPAAPAAAWAAIRCASNPTKVIRYPGSGMPWPMRARTNMPEGSLARTALEESVALWNSTQGALDTLAVSDTVATQCKAPNGAGYGVVGIDDGECADKLDLDWWGAGANGVRQYWVENCEIVATTLYVNPVDPESEAELGDVFSHELGHHMNYAHNWWSVSVMGYGVNMYWYLTSDDQSYLRTRFPSGGVAGADPHLHRTVLLTALGKEIQPDVHSQTTAPDPVCSPGDCQHLGAGSAIRLMMTYGNGGDRDTDGPVRISMYLGKYEIGAWEAAVLPAHSFNTYEFEARVPEGVPAGTYTLSLEIDSLREVPMVPGPSPARVREFPGFVVTGAGCTFGECGDVDTPTASAVLPVVTAKADEAVLAEGTGDGGSGAKRAGEAAGCAVSRTGSQPAGAAERLFVLASLAIGARALRRRRR